MISMRNSYLYKIVLFLSITMISAYLVTLYVASGLPVYPDEIAARLDHARIGYDFPYKTALAPMCKHAMLVYPRLWYVPAWVEWSLYGKIQNLLHLRMIGLFGSVLLLGLLVGKLSQNYFKRRVPIHTNIVFLMMCLGFVLGVLCIGVMPFFLVTLRYEQTMLCCLVIQVILFSLPLKNIHERIFAVIIYFFSVSILLYQHPKALFLTPILLIVGWRLFSHFKIAISVVLGGVLVLMIGVNYHIWVQMVDCAASPNVAALYSASTVNLQNIWHHPGLFLSEVGQSILNFKRELAHLRFHANSEIGYLPSITMTWTVRLFNKVLFFNYGVLVLSILILSVRAYYQDLRQKKVITSHLLLLGILFCAFLNFVLNLCKHWYDAGYLWALLVCAIVVYLAAHRAWILKQKATYFIMIYVLLVGIFSQFILLTHYWQPFREGFAGPSISLHHYDANKNEQILQKLSLLCQIDRTKARYLILDDATYFYFQQAPYPLAITYLLVGEDAQFLGEIGNKYPSDGMVVRARYLPASLQEKYAIKIDDFICVPKSNIQPLYREWLADRISARIDK